MILEELNEGLDCRSYLVADEGAGEALIVDPLRDRVEQYLQRLEALGLKLALVLDTHTHADHFSGLKELAQRTGARTAGAPASVVQLPLREGDVLTLGSIRLETWAAPGHTADSLVFLVPGAVLAGDTLLIGTTGRTDLPTGDAAQEFDSAHRLLTLPDETRVWPGHEYNQRSFSTIGEEKRENGRLQLAREKFVALMNEPRSTRPKLLEEALAYNSAP